MKKCPYCAEEIQDEAIKCRYCFSDLTVPPGAAGPATAQPDDAKTAPVTAPAASGAPASAGASDAAGTVDAPASVTPSDSATVGVSSVRYTHSGYRYVLGYGADFFALWDRQSPNVPTERFARTDDGWRQAWTRFITLEPNHVPVPQDGGAGSASPTTSGVAPDPNDTVVVQYTHSGTRYLLGYGRTFFGIWDRQAPDAPVERFGRDDAGWVAAWGRYTQLENHFTEVGLGGQPGSTGS